MTKREHVAALIAAGKWYELADHALRVGLTPDMISSEYPDLIADMKSIQEVGYAPLVEPLTEEEAAWYQEQYHQQALAGMWGDKAQEEAKRLSAFVTETQRKAKEEKAAREDVIVGGRIIGEIQLDADGTYTAYCPDPQAHPSEQPEHDGEILNGLSRHRAIEIVKEVWRHNERRAEQ